MPPTKARDPHAAAPELPQTPLDLPQQAIKLPSSAMHPPQRAMDLPAAPGGLTFARAGPTAAVVVHGKLLMQNRLARVFERLPRVAPVGHHHR